MRAFPVQNGFNGPQVDPIKVADFEGLLWRELEPVGSSPRTIHGQPTGSAHFTLARLGACRSEASR
jgi:hypothetical protein